MRIGIPEATLIVTLTALGLQILSNIVIRTLVDLKREKRLRNEVAAFDKELREAISKKDKDKEEKLKKKKPQVDKMRLQASTGRLEGYFHNLHPVHRRLLPDGGLCERLQFSKHLHLFHGRLLACSDPSHRGDRRDRCPLLVVLPFILLSHLRASEGPRHVDVALM